MDPIARTLEVGGEVLARLHREEGDPKLATRFAQCLDDLEQHHLALTLAGATIPLIKAPTIKE